MSRYNIHEAKTNLSKLLKQAAAGEEVIIAKAGIPVVRLVPANPTISDRVLGTEIGRILIPDDFDAPLPEDVLKDFEG